MVQAQHKKRKLSKVCSLEAYNYLENWIKEKNPRDRYPLPVKSYFYSNTGHREFLSKFIEAVIWRMLRKEGCDPMIAPDKGISVDRSQIVTDVIGRKRVIGGRSYIPNPKAKPGRADIVCFWRGQYWNFEIKVGADRQSAVQKAEQQRAERNGEKYVIIKTVDDFLSIFVNQ